MESNAWYPLFTATMILSGSAVHVKGFGFFVGFGDEAIDGGLEIDERVEDAAFEPPSCKFGEEALDGVEPGGRLA